MASQAEDLPDLQKRQIAILRSALAQLAPGGRLIYSTCSLEREENEAVVEAALAGTADFRILDCRGQLEELQRSGELSWKDIASLLAGPYLRTIPGVHPCDGFFAAMIGRDPTSELLKGSIRACFWVAQRFGVCVRTRFRGSGGTKYPGIQPRRGELT